MATPVQDNKVIDPKWNADNASYAPYMANPYNLMPLEPAVSLNTVPPAQVKAAMDAAIQDELNANAQKAANVQPAAQTSQQQPVQSNPQGTSMTPSTQDILTALFGASAAPGLMAKTAQAQSVMPQVALPPQAAKQLPAPAIRMPDQTSGPTINVAPTLDKSQARAFNAGGQDYYIQNGTDVFDRGGTYIGKAAQIIPNNMQGALRTLGLLSRADR